MSVLDKARLHLVDSVDSAAELLRWLSTQDRISLDCETTGLSIERDRVRMVQVGAHDDGWSIPFERWGGVVEDVVRRFEGIYTNHNLISYDAPMLKKEGIILPMAKCRDTRLMCHVLESTGSLALKSQAARHVDRRAATMQQLLDEAMKAAGWTWATVPWNFGPYWQYAALDTLLAYHLEDVIWPRVQADAPFAYDLEAATSWVVDKMERHGVAVDQAYTQRLVERLDAYVAQMTTWCKDRYGVYPGSDQQIIDALLRDGVTLTKRTRGGRLSVDKEVLGALDHPLAVAVLNRRKADKMVGTYLRNYLEMSRWDGRIHPSINTVGGMAKNHFEPGGGKGVRTGRMSMNDPNLQNVPVRGVFSKIARDAFVADEGCVWVKCDADQIEMRIFASQCEDEGMISAFRRSATDGSDFFVNMAQAIFDEPDFKKSDPRRQWVKNGGYAWIYGAGIPKYAATVGIDIETAAAFMRRVDQLYPGGRRFVNHVQVEAQRRLREEGEAYYRSPLTGRKHVADEDRMYALMNYLVQGTAAEVLKLKMVQADQAGLGDMMLLPVHDEVDFAVPEDRIGEFLPTLRDVMNDDAMFKVPLTWSMAVGQRWGSCEDVEV